MSKTLSDRYQPQDVEGRIYKWWEESAYFKAQSRSTKPPYCIILPPPNVTGFLHMGHAWDHTIQDVLIRWKRMRGFNALWLPGTDHAGIATQSVVEKNLKKEGLQRHELGREEFVQRVWDWKHQYGDRICQQMRRLGDSCDWDRNTFTLDPGVSKAVRRVFVQLFKKGQIYRGLRLVNWSPPLETAISDLEVEHKTVKGSLYHIEYPLADGEGKIVVATTRPETMLGDSAVCVHPEDERYKAWIGKTLRLPLTDREIPIIADSYVDSSFGSGALKITPAHDFNDYQLGRKHKLEVINILEKNGKLNANAGAYQGLSVNEARKKVLQDLKDQGLLLKEEPHTHSVGHCSRSGAVVEPYLSEQWFLKTSEISIPAKRTVESGTTQFEPESWTKTYLHWMEIIEDWCISRQLWWGHRIPAWACQSCGHINVSEEDPSRCEKCGSHELKQDEDVLDTWFSSALWPFSTMGWPEETETLKTFYPTSVLVTGHDIIFFWVARMMQLGLEFMKDVPFRKVYIHGLIRDSQGKKMSKSAGNSVDPVELIEKYGADALRFMFMAQTSSGRDIKFSEPRLEGYRNFMNKIWNASRFALGHLEDFSAPVEGTAALPEASSVSVFDRWILRKLENVEKSVDQSLEAMRFSDAASDLYHFVWNDFCDWYIELIKPTLTRTETPAKERQATQLVLAQVLNRTLRLLHPFIPFITEELYAKLPIKGEACIIDDYPHPQGDRELLGLGTEQAEFEVDLLKEVITSIRNIRGENRISPAEQIQARLAPSDDRAQKILLAYRETIKKLARLSELEVGEAGSMKKSAVSVVPAGESEVRVIIPLEGLVDLDEELKRITKAIEKLSKEMQGIEKRLGNENFLKNAAPEVVEADQEAFKSGQARLAALKESYERLS